MPQQNIYPNSSEQMQFQHKITLLLLVDRIQIPISNNQITKFALEENYMNFYNVQQYLKEMVVAGFLDTSQDGNTTRYTLTDEGLKTLKTFASYIPPYLKGRIDKYIEENKGSVKQDLEIIANHFFQHDNEEYVVKCAIYEEDNMLMELSISVVSKEQAISVCTNWKNNVKDIYPKIIDILLKQKVDKKAPEKGE